VGGLIVLAVAHLLTHDKQSGWLLDCVALAVFFVVFGNFGFSSILWVPWITLIAFVFLRLKPDFKILKVVAANLILFVTLFSVVELPFRLAENSESNPNIQLGVEFDSKYFVQIRKKSYFREAEFASKSKPSVLSPNEEYYYVNRNLIKFSDNLATVEDFDGAYINIRNGRRVTEGATGIRQKRVLVFGGSTVFCAEVPDSMTIPSQLQKIILDNKFELDVINYGIPGIRIENQSQILETVQDLGPGDVVVFYDGINDLNTVFRLGLESNKSVIPLGFVKEVAAWVESHSLLARGLISGYIDRSGISKDFLNTDAENEVAGLWIKNDKIARTFVEIKGAQFVHILQPNWVTYKGGVEATKDNKRWADMKVIQNYFEKYANPETKIENFTKKLDGLSSTPFIDWAHLDEIGNKKIAEDMFGVLEPMLKAQGR
jgi:lysophospholipase L1-like esterase